MSPDDLPEDVAPEDAPENAPENADDVRAGEYVLGVLDAADRAAVAARVAADAGFAARVARWEAFFAPLAAAPEPAAAPEAVWARLEARLDPPAPAARVVPLRRRGAAAPVRARSAPVRFAWAAALAAAVVLAGATWAALGTRRPSTVLVAVLAPAADAPADGRGVVTVYTGEGRLAPAFAASPRPGRAAELWLIKPGAAPAALGLVGRETFGPAAQLIRGAKAGDVVAVSVEPPGGSPGAGPTGPVVATGVLQAL